MTDSQQTLGFAAVAAEGLEDWPFFLDRLHGRFETGSFARGLELITRIAEAAEAATHHPDIELTYPRVEVRLVSHDVGGVTSRDIELARQISAIARELGVPAAPGDVSTLELALDVPDISQVGGFWATVLGSQFSASASEVRDPQGRINTLWFQDAPQASGEVQQRFHLDIVVPRAVAPERVRAAVEAGGTLVTDEYAPAFWVLADAYGNKVCVCTADGRESNPSNE